MINILDSLKVTVIAEDSVQYESPFWGQHGISFLLEAEYGNRTNKVMIDVGQNYEALEHNMEILKIDPSSIDALVLTHCHYDHTRGIHSLLHARKGKELPVIAHPDIFRLHFIADPFLRHVGISAEDSRQKLESAGARLFLASDPLEIMPGLWTTGEIPRKTDFEDAGIALKTIHNGRIQEDQVMDDISVAAVVKDRGLAIITGCSHAGIVNICLHALELFPGLPIETIIGGLHLVEAEQEKIDLTVKALEDMNPAWIASGHCTGFRAQFGLFQTFGERFEPLASGKIFRI